MANNMPSGNRGGQTGGATREHAEEAKGHLQQAGSHAKEAASSAMSDAGQKAQEFASGVAQRAGEYAASAQERADDALSSMGHRMSSMAGSLRQGAPREGMLGSAASTVADQLESGGRYLQRHGLGDIGDDLGGVIRTHPIPSLLVAFGVGLLIGMAGRK